MNSMTGIEAIKYVVDYFGVTSKSDIARALSGDGLEVQPIQISNYLKGTQMSQKVADRFLSVYGIVVKDAHNPTDLALTMKALEIDK